MTHARRSQRLLNLRTCPACGHLFGSAIGQTDERDTVEARLAEDSAEARLSRRLQEFIERQRADVAAMPAAVRTLAEWTRFAQGREAAGLCGPELLTWLTAEMGS